MFNRKRDSRSSQHKNRPSIGVAIQSLENRVLLHHGFGGFGGFGGGFGGGGSDGGGFGGGSLTSIEFSQAPTAVQTGLDKLATADGLTPPATTSTQTVFLGNRNGVETYSIDISGTGTESVLTVDQDGNPVTAPTNGTTTYGAVPAAVSTEASTIATALSLTVPASTADVSVTTPSVGTSVYTIHFTSSSTSTTTHTHGRTVQINADGDPVGNGSLPFSAIPTAIQTALNTNRPSAATALATTSTQAVHYADVDGVQTYSTTFTTSGTSTTVTVNASGDLAKLPTHTTTTFSALSTTVQNAISTLATDNGVTTAIASTAKVYVYTEANGTIIYSVTVSGSKTGSSGTTYTFDLTISVDENGNPTTLPSDNGDGGGGYFGSSFGGFQGDSVDGGFGFFGRRHR
jgi:hypothetical protein